MPSSFLVDAFVSGGVPREKLVLMPIPIDTHVFSPLPFAEPTSSASMAPLPLPNKGDFNFLSIFKWEDRKGWDILLEAYFSEFKPEVCFAFPLGSPQEHSCHARSVPSLGKNHALPADLRPPPQSCVSQVFHHLQGEAVRSVCCQGPGQCICSPAFTDEPAKRLPAGRDSDRGGRTPLTIQSCSDLSHALAD